MTESQDGELGTPKESKRQGLVRRVAARISAGLRANREREVALIRTNEQMAKGPELLAAAKRTSEAASGPFGSVARVVAKAVKLQDAAEKQARPGLDITPDEGHVPAENSYLYRDLHKATFISSDRISMRDEIVAAKVKLGASPLDEKVSLFKVELGRQTEYDFASDKPSDTFLIRLRGTEVDSTQPATVTDEVTITKGEDGEMVWDALRTVQRYRRGGQPYELPLDVEQVSALIAKVEEITEAASAA